jgi:selenocysteine insertion sequence-binding protein 2
LLIEDIVKFQDRQYHRDPVKAFARRRYVLGFREVMKYLLLKKLKLIIIAPDLEVSKLKGVIKFYFPSQGSLKNALQPC